jgi:hypothetical protein
MELVTAEFHNLVETLLSKIQPEDFPDEEEYRLGLELKALPIGYDLFSYVFLKSNGEVLWSEWEEDKILRSNETQVLIRAIVQATKRYPQFEKFIPARPKNAEVCRACNGSKLWGGDVSKKQHAKCVFCAGLGWTVIEE